MQETYSWKSGMKRLSRDELRKMKENMQKTPLIQKQAEQYHNKESKEAEALLNKIEIPSEKQWWKLDIQPPKKIWFFQKIKNYLFW